MDCRWKYHGVIRGEIGVRSACAQDYVQQMNMSVNSIMLRAVTPTNGRVSEFMATT